MSVLSLADGPSCQVYSAVSANAMAFLFASFYSKSDMKSENLICLEISLLFTLCAEGFGGFDLCDDLGVGAEGHTDRRGRRKFFKVFFEFKANSFFAF